MTTFGIIGNGFVGNATARCWMEHGEVKVYDVDPRKATHSLAEASTCNIVFVCLPTPENCDTAILDGFFASLPDSDSIYVIKSTVPVGTTKRLARTCRVVHSPEFLTARCAVTDAQCPARMIIGEPHAWWGDKLSALYSERFPGVQVLTMNSNASELVKLACNSFFAMKVSYFNEIYDACQRDGIDWGDVRLGILSDGRIAHSHTTVPGPDGKRGFGGACLPKDTTALAEYLDSDVLRAVLERNREVRG